MLRLLLLHSILCVVVILASTLSAFAQHSLIPQKSIYFEHIATPSVVQSVVYSIMQDSRGFMWFGTKDGLYRYDGLHTTIFLHNPLDSLSISDNRILNIYEDYDSDLWIATQDGGLNLFDRARATFRHYQAHNQAKDGVSTTLQSNRVIFVYQDRSRQIWVGTENGLHQFDKKRQIFSVLKAAKADSTALASKYIRSCYETRNGTLWFGTVAGGLSRWNAASKTFTTYKHLPNNSRTIADNTIHAITEDHEGMLWLATARGLSVFNPTTGAARTYVNNPALPSSLSENIVWDVVSTRSRQLWVATQNGLNLFHPETQDFTRFVEDSYRSDNGRLPNNYVNTLYEDTQGRLWIGMYGGGVCVIDHLKRKFDIVRRETLSNPLQTLPDNNIWAAYQDKNNIVWVGTVRGLAAYNPTTKTIRAFHNDTLRLGSMSDNINFISGDSTGKIWCSTFGGGVNVFDTTKKRFVAHYGFQEGNVRSLPNDRVTTVYCSKQGELWIGTINGACRYVPKTNDFEPCFTGARNSQELSHPTIKYFFEDSKGRFWIGTASGLNLVNLQTGTVTRFKSIPNDTTTLSHNNIRQIIEDKQHRLWIATSGGLNLLLESASDKPQDIAFKRITTANGLPSNHISGVLADEQNTLWIPHSSGVCSFDPASFRVVREFDTEDGLQGQEFRATAALNLHDGRLFFGGSNGFNTFNPASLLTDSTKPRIVFTNFKVFNQVRKLPVSITEAREITLSHKDYIFSLEFAALDFTNSAKTRYAYKMEGFDQDWVQNGDLRSATYTNLRGGEYLFRVKSSNHDGVWNEEGITLKITIIPPLWETWWFRGVSIGGLLLAIFGAVRIREQSIKRQNALLESTVAERTAALLHSNYQLSEANEQLRLANVEKNEFLGIVAHDLKNPLSTIKLAAKLMNEEAPNLEVSDFREITADILTTSNRMFDLITNLLDVNRLEQNAVKFTPQNIDLVPMLHHSVAQFTPLADAKALEILLETPKSSVIAFADESATMQVLDNIVSNAVKYSPQGKKIYCSAVARILENGEQIVQIAVRDEGPGLSEEDMKKLFGKFARLSAQPTGGEHSTGLGLSIVKKMVEAMNGRVYCVSTLGKGATFIVELPQGA